MKIYWRLFIDVATEDGATKVLTWFIKKVPGTESNNDLEPYQKCGYVCTCVTPIQASTWDVCVYEAIKTAQTVARGWILHGNIETELDTWSNDTIVKGVQNMHMMLMHNKSFVRDFRFAPAPQLNR